MTRTEHDVRRLIFLTIVTIVAVVLFSALIIIDVATHTP